MATLGGLAGFSSQMAVREFFVKSGKIKLEDAFVTITTKSGEVFYFGDLSNEPLVTSNKGQHSVWGFVAGAAQHLGATKLPDLKEIFGRVAASVGNTDFGTLSVPPQNTPHRPVIELLNLFWNPVRNLLVVTADTPGSWPFVLGQAAQVAMLRAKGVIDPCLAARIVMESAVPMSKIDPSRIFNAHL